MRKLATIRRIDELNPIEGADAIECATVGGWKVVAQKGLYNVGDLAVYFEIDSWIPHELAPFLSKGKEPREFEGVKGERLRTIKLRGQLSQGLLMPFGVVMSNYDGEASSTDWNEGDDITELLGILKWEKSIPAQLAGVCKGNFPTAIPKTDQERVQNLKKELQSWVESSEQFEVSIKLDGSSMTVALLDSEVHVCSRNLSLKLDQIGNSFVDTARALGLINSIRELGREFAIQGELCGPGIQKNQEKLTSLEFFVFDIYDIKRGEYLPSLERQDICEKLGLKHVPIINESVSLKELNVLSVEDALIFAEGASLTSQVQREGVVFKSIDGSKSFKAISNAWLLKNE